MYHCSSDAGYDLPDVQLRLISSPTWYCSSSPVMCGPSLGRSAKQKTNRSGIRVLSDVGPGTKYMKFDTWVGSWCWLIILQLYGMQCSTVRYKMIQRPWRWRREFHPNLQPAITRIQGVTTKVRIIKFGKCTHSLTVLSCHSQNTTYFTLRK
jgi:hypothetical protein